jgi:hypothetical protein
VYSLKRRPTECAEKITPVTSFKRDQKGDMCLYLERLKVPQSRDCLQEISYQSKDHEE